MAAAGSAARASAIRGPGGAALAALADGAEKLE
jgi:hypothetical protein